MLRGHRCCLGLVTLAMVLWRAEMTQACWRAVPEQMSADSSSSCHSDPESQACDTPDTENYKPQEKEVKDWLEFFQELRDSLGGDARLEYEETGEVTGVVFTNNDACCSAEFRYRDVKTLTDMRGKTQTIAQYPHVDSPQLIRTVRCSNSGPCKTNGVCVPQNALVTMALYPSASDNSLRIGQFDLPQFCVCQVPKQDLNGQDNSDQTEPV